MNSPLVHLLHTSLGSHGKGTCATYFLIYPTVGGDGNLKVVGWESFWMGNESIWVGNENIEICQPKWTLRIHHF